ncbi:MAG: hypothetical protein AB1505_17890 [Candidatus Latescibacterota bacterium]
MRYKIALAVSGQHPSIEISAEEYAAIREAKRDLIVFLGIEEKFDLLIANYVEYESTLLAIATHQMIYWDLNWDSAQNDIHLVNRRLVNLLSAARLYVDQVRHDVERVCPAGVDVVKTLTAAEYDNRFGYRVMEALRNYVQHRSLPVHWMSWPTSVDRPEDPSSGIRFGVVPSLNPDAIETEGGFKRETLDELHVRSKANRDKPIPLTPLVREYVEGLAKVNEGLREHVQADVTRCGKMLTAVEERARREIRPEPIGLAVVAEDDGGLWPEIDHIFGDLWTRRQALARKNRLHDRLSRRYVSGRGIDE